MRSELKETKWFILERQFVNFGTFLGTNQIILKHYKNIEDVIQKSRKKAIFMAT